MKQTIRALLLCLAVFSVNLYGAQLLPSELSDLQEKSDLIVVAQVTKVKAVSLGREGTPYDQVTISIASIVKGKVNFKEIDIITEPRGMRDFDPELKEKQNAVFFLIETEEWGYRLTAQGSVAILGGHFTIEQEGQIQSR